MMNKQRGVISKQFSVSRRKWVLQKTTVNRLLLASFLVITLALGSCVEQIDFPLNRGTSKLVVSGQISNLPEHKYVFLSETTSSDRAPILSGQYYVLNDLPRPVSGNVLLVNEFGDKWSFKETAAGKYRLDSSIVIEEDVLYHLDITVKGRNYTSTPEKMPEVVGTDEVAYTFDRGVLRDRPDIAFISINTEVTLPTQNGGYYLRWDVDEVYFWDLTFFPNAFNRAPPNCYVFGFPEPERITLLNGDQLGISGTITSQTLAKRIIDESFLSRHYFNVRQASISKSAYEYWRKVRELVNNTGSVFDTPPAPIRGNLFNTDDESEIVLGYFEVARVAQTRIYTTRADVPFFEPEVCTYSPTRLLDDYPKTCLRCSEFPNSTGETPHWWFDQ